MAMPNHPGRGARTGQKRISAGHVGGGRFTKSDSAPWIRKGTGGRPDETFLPVHRTGTMEKTYDFDFKKKERVLVMRRARLLYNGRPLPEHFHKIGIPADWTDVHVNRNPNGWVMAVGRDGAGNPMIRRSAKMVSSVDAKKYAKLEYLNRTLPAIAERNNAHRPSNDDPRWDKDEAACALAQDHSDGLATILHTGMRIGNLSKKNTKKGLDSYGLVNLESKHVVQSSKGQVFLRFAAKGGTPTTLPITDGVLAKRLLKRKEVYAGGRIFPEMSSGSMRKHISAMNPGRTGLTPKDFRMAIANRVAMAKMKTMLTPTNPAEFKKAQKEVGLAAGVQLGHSTNRKDKKTGVSKWVPTGSTALKSYINPAIFDHWRASAHVEG